MATAEQLINDAQYALGNVSPGSNNEKKYASQARRFALRVISKYPTSIEAEQARSILRQLGDQNDIRVPLSIPTSAGTNRISGHSSKQSAQGKGKDRGKPPNTYTWNEIWLAFSSVPYAKKKALFFVMFFVAVILVSFPFLALALFLYFPRAHRFKEHLYKLLTALA